MQKAMSLEALLIEVQRQSNSKRDYIANTESQVHMLLEGNSLFIELRRPGVDLMERLTISDSAHRQIAARLNIPWKYYTRLLTTHPDLIQLQVNELFVREPEKRMVRVLDGEVRAFLSDSFLRLDNDVVLSNTLPSIIKGDFETTILGSNVDASSMNLKILFTGDELAHEVAVANGRPRLVRPGFRLSNSEIGSGALKIEGFFYDEYCTNGCVFGVCDLFKFKRTHIGARIPGNANLEPIGQPSQALNNSLILSQATNVMRTLSNPENVRTMAVSLRDAANTESVKDPEGAVTLLAKTLKLRDQEKESMLATFLRDQDYTKFGMASALTEVANDKGIASFSRACAIEDLGGQILSLKESEWQRYVEADDVDSSG